MRRPLPGASRNERIAPDVAAAGGRKHQPVQLRNVPSAQRGTKPPIDDRQQLSLGSNGPGGNDPQLGEAGLHLGEQGWYVGLDMEGIRQQQRHEDDFLDPAADQFVDDLHATWCAVIQEGDVDVELRPDSQQTLSDLMTDLRHLRVVASVAEEDQ
jgi:hypothetical protein